MQRWLALDWCSWWASCRAAAFRRELPSPAPQLPSSPAPQLPSSRIAGRAVVNRRLYLTNASRVCCPVELLCRPQAHKGATGPHTDQGHTSAISHPFVDGDAAEHTRLCCCTHTTTTQLSMLCGYGLQCEKYRRACVKRRAPGWMLCCRSLSRLSTPLIQG